MICAYVSGAEKTPPGEIPLYSKNGYPIVPFYIFDHWRWFVLDTQSEITTLHSTFTNHLRAVNPATADPLQEKAPLADFYFGHLFYLGKLQPFPKYFAVKDLSVAERLSGSTVDGFLALDVLTNYQLTLDFAATNAIFHTSSIEPAPGGLPFKLEGNVFAFQALLGNGKHLFLGVDTVDQFELSLNPEDWQKAFPDGLEKTNRVMVADRRGKFSEEVETRLPLLKIGEATYTNLLCRRLRDKSAPSVVGSAFLRRHRVTLDYPNRQIRFQRVTNDQSAEADMSGIHLKWIRRSAVIASIDPDSPAEKIGLAEGDELLRIDGELVMWMSPEKIDQLFRRDGVTVEVVALHGVGEVTKSMVLKRRI